MTRVETIPGVLLHDIPEFYRNNQVRGVRCFQGRNLRCNEGVKSNEPHLDNVKYSHPEQYTVNSWNRQRMCCCVK